MARNNTPTISIVGERLDLEVRQGSTLGPIRHQLSMPDDTPFDLTGYTFRAAVRRSAANTKIVATFDITMPSPEEGWYEMKLTDEVTAAFEVGISSTAVESRYAWDSEMETPDGDVTPLFFGELRVQPEVTRPQDE